MRGHEKDGEHSGCVAKAASRYHNALCTPFSGTVCSLRLDAKSLTINQRSHALACGAGDTVGLVNDSTVASEHVALLNGAQSYKSVPGYPGQPSVPGAARSPAALGTRCCRSPAASGTPPAPAAAAPGPPAAAPARLVDLSMTVQNTSRQTSVQDPTAALRMGMGT